MTKLSDGDYQALADFRYALRRFVRYSEAGAEAAGLTPRQHQALLAIRAGPGGALRVGELAERLLLRPHSASELAQRMEEQGLVRREPGAADKRQVRLRLNERGEALLETISQRTRTELRRLRPMLQELLAGLG